MVFLPAGHRYYNPLDFFPEEIREVGKIHEERFPDARTRPLSPSILYLLNLHKETRTQPPSKIIFS